MADTRFTDWLGRIGAVLGVLVLALFGVRSIWDARPRDRTELVVWGLPSGEETKGQDAQIREFERRFPHIQVQNLSMGAGGMNAQKLMTSIAGGVPPDLVRQDRFTIGDWASRDTFRPLDDLLADPKLNAADDPWRIAAEDYYPRLLGGGRLPGPRLRHPRQHGRPAPLLEQGPLPGGRPGSGAPAADLGRADRASASG